MDEFLEIVDENNNVIGKKLRSIVHSTGLLHRGIHIIICNSQSMIYLPTRSESKDKYPGCFDVSVSEHCNVEEKYDTTATRGLKEELHIEKAELKRYGVFRIDCGPNDKMISAIYECVYDGPMIIDKEEIKKIRLVTREDLKNRLERQPEKFAPWSREIFKWYLGMLSDIERITQ